MRKWRKHDRVGKNDKNNKKENRMTEAKNSDYFGKSPFDDLKNVTNTVMDVIKQDRDRKLAIAQATAEVSAKQQEELKNQQSEDQVMVDKKGE